MKNKADTILDMIRGRQGKTVPKDVDESPIQKTLTQEQWTRFAKIYVEEIGGSKVDKNTGLSNKEFLDKFALDKDLFIEYNNVRDVNTSKLAAFLRSLDHPKNKFDDLFSSKSGWHSHL